MTIQPIILYLLIAFITALFIILIIILLKKSERNNQAESFERIINKLEKLEQVGLEVDNLSRIFLIPHVRGGFGETMLEELLKNWLPAGSFKMQHTFKNGYRVDAIIRFGSYFVPVDAKFPLESIKNGLTESKNNQTLAPDVKRTFIGYAEDISKKYINTAEGTLEFALMYIPSERVYYQAFVQEDNNLLQQALKYGVVPVSPSGLFLYLQTVAFGLRGFSLPEKQKLIIRLIDQIKKDFTDFARNYNTAGTHLRNLQKAYDDSLGKFNKLDVSVQRFDSHEDGMQPEQHE